MKSLLFSLTPAEIPFPEERQFVFDAKTSLLKRELNRASGLRRMLDAIRQLQTRHHLPALWIVFLSPASTFSTLRPLCWKRTLTTRQEYRKRGHSFIG